MVIAWINLCERGHSSARLAVNKESAVKSPTEDVAETGQEEGLTIYVDGADKMPMNGGTRMLRARRKDINVKPNRRLDRKSSRGMLFENEELRMRTITINAEVEQGQHALKKLRRENEQLRREMWSLRDEYDKMEKLLRKKEEDDEDSDQEISDSDDNDSQTEEAEEKKSAAAEEEEEIQKEPVGKFENTTSARAFDGLSVIDEQTEETQTTETGCCAGSRGDSANRTLNQVAPTMLRLYAEHPGYPFYDSGFQSKTGRRKMFAAYDSDAECVAYGTTGWPDNGYDVRPASPYPYPESVQPSYQKRFQVLQNLPPMMTSRIDENGWVFPNPAKANYDLFARDPFVGGPFLPNKTLTSPISIEIPQQMDYDVVRDRTGPDVFVSGVCTEKAQEDVVVGNVGAEMEKIEIGETTDGNAKSAALQDEICKALPEAKLTTAKSADEGDAVGRGATDDSVPGQNPCHKHVRSAFDSEEMAKVDKASKFQSKLTVTLKTPAKSDANMPKRVPPVQVPRNYQTIGYGPKQDFRGKLCGLPECRYVPPDGIVVVPGNSDDVVSDAEDIPLRRVQDGLGLLTEVETASGFGVKPVKIPPAPPPRTTSSLGTVIPDPATGIATVPCRTFATARSPRPGRTEAIEAFARNPLMLSEPMATSSPTIRTLGLDDQHSRLIGTAANDESSTEDISTRRAFRAAPPHLNKSVSSPSFGTFLRRKPSEHSVSSTENGATLCRQADRKISRGHPQNNVSVSSSSGLDSPTKSDRRKRRVSIKFNKKAHPEDGVERPWDSRKDTAGVKHRGKVKTRHEETDVTTSERERTNSASSRASSGEGRRKLSVSSSRTYVNDDKIPWCGCWGNGCV